MQEMHKKRPLLTVLNQNFQFGTILCITNRHYCTDAHRSSNLPVTTNLNIKSCF